jgi:2-keto-3-deoxy-L-rhamnonate aldolase RhmA
VIPQLETVEQAKHVCSAAKFGTKYRGTRSAPPFRMIPGLTDMGMDGQRDVWSNLNDQAAIMVQIESLEGINNLDAILTECPEIDVVWLGSLDCRISMNLPANFGQGTEPEWLAAVDKFNATVKKHNKPKAGFSMGGAEDMAKAAQENVILLTSADVMQLMQMAPQLAAAREAVALKKE